MMAAKRGRIVIRAAAGLVAAAVLIMALCLEGIDYQPYLRSPYYSETMGRLRSQARTNALPRGELKAGFGRALLTPTVNASADDPEHGRFRALPLAGYGGRRGRPATGTHDDLYVKAAALQVEDRLGVLVGADALIIPREVTELAVRRLETELKLRREQVYLSATHSHSSLGGWGEGIVAESFAGKFQPGVRVWMADRIVAAVREAVADLKPSSIGQGSFIAPKFIRNRLVGPLGQADPEFSYIVVKQREGRMAVLGSFSAHATTLSSGMMEFSGDYPGCWERAVEQATGGMAVFLAGGVGSHSPVPGDSAFKGSEKMGQALAKSLLESLSHASLTNQVAFDLVGLEVTLPPLHARITDGIRLRPWVSASFLPVGKRSFIQACRIGQAIWISTPCDLSGELALGVKDTLRARGFTAALTSFNGDYLGYIIPSRYYHLDGYEPRLMSFFGPYAGDYFDDLIRTLALELAKR